MLKQIEEKPDMDIAKAINEVALCICNQTLLAKKRKKTSFGEGILAFGMACARAFFDMFREEDCFADDATCIYGLSITDLNALEDEMKENACQSMNFLF